MMPMYMNKAKVTDKEIKKLVDDETWLSATDMLKYFDVTILNEEKVAVASIKSNLFKNYKHVPDYFKNTEVKDEREDEIKAKLGLINISLKLKEKRGMIDNE